MRILVIEPDNTLRKLLVEQLSQSGFNVQAGKNASEMRRLMKRYEYNFFVLDTLEHNIGLDLCKELKQQDQTSVILISNNADDESKLDGFAADADDFICKPLNPRELIARINAINNRITAKPQTKLPDEIVKIGNASVNFTTGVVTKGTTQSSLDPSELSTLKLLVSCNYPINKKELTEKAKTRPNALEIQIARIRKLVEPNPAAPRYIQTVWGLGYVFVPDITSVEAA